MEKLKIEIKDAELIDLIFEWKSHERTIELMSRKIGEIEKKFWGKIRETYPETKDKQLALSFNTFSDSCTITEK